MNRILLLFILIICLSSCSKKQSQEDNEKLILGDWALAGFDNKHYGNLTLTLPPAYRRGFTFYQNNTFDNRQGYFASVVDSGVEKRLFLGTKSKYEITNNTIRFFSLKTNSWDEFEILKLTVDSLKFGKGGSINIYRHLKIKPNNTPPFDEIVLSSSSCEGTCPIFSIIVKTDGKVLFNGEAFTGKDGLFEGSIPRKTYQQLEDNFRKEDFNSLQNNYAARWTDDQSITTTFVKNGKIFKTVEDYGRVAPDLFIWGYVPLENIYQAIPLKKAAYPGFMYNNSFITDLGLRKKDSVLDIKRSEMFLLFDYLRQGKVVNQNFRPYFKIRTYFNHHRTDDINTDGRYFTFLDKGKPITVDIGFNFYDINEKHWKWRKANEYD